MARRKDSEAGGGDIDSLFQLPPTEFTAARNALAARLKKAGKGDEAARVKELVRPPVSAWAVNQLHWRHGRELAGLLAAGERFRQAQGAQLAGRKADLRGTLEAWREALAAMTATAADLLRRADHTPTPDLMRRISTTLEALAAYGLGDGAARAGHLTADLEPPGFEALAALVPMGGSSARGGAPPRVLPFADKKGRGAAKKSRRALSPEEEKRRQDAERAAAKAAARKTLEAAQKKLAEVRRDALHAEAAFKKAAAHAKLADEQRARAERERADAEARWEKASTQADQMTRESRRVAREAEEAAQAVSDAEAEVERARKELETIE